MPQVCLGQRKHESEFRLHSIHVIELPPSALLLIGSKLRQDRKTPSQCFRSLGGIFGAVWSHLSIIVRATALNCVFWVIIKI